MLTTDTLAKADDLANQADDFLALGNTPDALLFYGWAEDAYASVGYATLAQDMRTAMQSAVFDDGE